MKQQCFSVCDNKTGYFHVPFFSPTVPSGKRMFQEACRDTSTLMSKYPEDFTLWHVGEFDDNDGRLTQFDPPGQIAKALDYVKGE